MDCRLTWSSFLLLSNGAHGGARQRLSCQWRIAERRVLWRRRHKVVVLVPVARKIVDGKLDCFGEMEVAMGTSPTSSIFPGQGRQDAVAS